MPISGRAFAAHCVDSVIIRDADGSEDQIWSRLNFDASVCYDSGSVFGSIADSVQRTMDVNVDGVISPPETRAFVIDNAHPSPVDSDYHYWSYSAGANYGWASDLCYP